MVKACIIGDYVEIDDINKIAITNAGINQFAGMFTGETFNNPISNAISKTLDKDKVEIAKTLHTTISISDGNNLIFYLQI